MRRVQQPDDAHLPGRRTSAEEGGDRGLHDWMTDYLDNNYVAGWEFLTIDDLGIGQPDE